MNKSDKTPNKLQDTLEDISKKIKTINEDIANIKEIKKNHFAFWLKTIGLIVLFIAWISQNYEQHKWDSKKQEYDYRKLLASFGDQMEVVLDFNSSTLYELNKLNPSDTLQFQVNQALTHLCLGITSEIRDLYKYDAVEFLGYNKSEMEQKLANVEILVNQIYSAHIQGKVDSLLIYRHLLLDTFHSQEIMSLRHEIKTQRKFLTQTAEKWNTYFLCTYIFGSILLSVSYILSNKLK